MLRNVLLFLCVITEYINFQYVMDTGLANDVLGEINTIVALLFCIVIIAPRFVRTEKSLNSSVTDQRDRTLLKIMRVLLQLVPVILIALIALGYYYTALNLITHIINTYIAWVVWSLVRHTILSWCHSSIKTFSLSSFTRKTSTKTARFK